MVTHCPSHDWERYYESECIANGDCMKDVFENVAGLDAAKWDITDFYPEHEKALRDVIAIGGDWDTGWYACKKEIQSGRVWSNGSEVICYASVSDDFDTEGYGESSFSLTPEIAEDVDHIMELIESHLYAALESAQQDRSDNALYLGYSVGEADESGRPVNWLYTYITPQGWGGDLDAPPGDNYHEWGWQDCLIGLPEDTINRFEQFAEGFGEGTLVIGNWYIKSWE